MSRRFDPDHDGPAMRKCEALGLRPIHAPMGEDHHTEVPLSDEDRAIGDALAWFLGGLFIDVEHDHSYMHTKMTSVDAWSRVARALRIHGLRIVNGQSTRPK